MAQIENSKLSPPIMFTIALILIALPLQPIPGIDIIYDIFAVCFAGSKWMQYAESAKQIASTVRPVETIPDATEFFAQGYEAREKGKFAEAFRLFKQSAQAGNCHAMNSIGLMYLKGNGCTINYTLAAEWFEKAITKGDQKYAPVNIELVGTVYFNGEQTAKDVNKAARLWRIAANTGLSEGQYDMGLLHTYGVGGVPKDETLARHWYGLAAANGHQAALEALRKLDGERGERQNAGSRDIKMTRAAALELLELNEGATKAEMKKAYMRLMQQVHPDKGGSNYFAKQLNEAREVLEF